MRIDDPSLPLLVGYLQSWNAFREETPAFLSLPLAGVTHLIYSYASVKGNTILLRKPALDSEKPFAAGKDRNLRGALGQLCLLKERFPSLEILLSLAGGAYGFSQAASTPANRQEFAQNACRFLRRWPIFTGLDLDWEFPVTGLRREALPGLPADKFNFTKLTRTLRQALQTEACRQGRHLSLSIALATSPRRLHYVESYELSKWVDFMTIMTYDLVCPQAYFMLHNAPLYEDPAIPFLPCGPASLLPSSAILLSYLRAGIPPQKLHMGLPFYGREYSSCTATGGGEYQPCVGPQKADTSIDYRDICTQFLQDKTTQCGFNRRSLVPYLFHPGRRTFVTYDDCRSLAYKVAWAHRYRLGGLSIWALDADEDHAPLLRGVRQTWHSPHFCAKLGTSLSTRQEENA